MKPYKALAYVPSMTYQILRNLCLFIKLDNLGGFRAKVIAT